MEYSLLVNEAMQDSTQIFTEFISRKPEPVIRIKYDKCFNRGYTGNI